MYSSISLFLSYTNVATMTKHSIERQVNTSQQKDKATQRTTRPKQSFFKEKLAASGGITQQF